MSTEKIREEYNAWYAEKIGVLGTRQHKEWFAPWSASRASIEVELPKIVDKEWANTHAERSAMREAIEWCKKRIESLGLKVKP